MEKKMNEKKLLEKGWRKLLKILRHSTQLEELLNILLTSEERAGLSKRILIIEALLKSEKTQREISKYLNVSIAKITRGSNALKNSGLSLKKFADDEFL
jgi:TrpR family transcriptional regulator, trp operon repressor